MSVDAPDYVIATILIVCALLIAYFARRDPRWKKVRIGVFLERERLDNSDDNEERK